MLLKRNNHMEDHCLFKYYFVICLSSLSIFLMSTVSFAAAPLLGNRNFNVVNQCPYPVWFSFNGASASNTSGGKSCTTNSDCVPGAVCNSSNKSCYYATPTPASGQYKLNANGGQTSLKIPMYQTNQDKIWSGRAAARTNCASGICETGDCAGGQGPCPLGKGFQDPVTIAEFTLNKSNSDFYDISLVNGMSIPVAMSPLRTHEAQTANLHVSPYDCGAPGATTPITALGKCTWNMVVPSNDFKRVLKGGSFCTTNQDCQAPNVCGISSDPKRTPRLLKTCGKVIGYWTPDEICGEDKNYGTPFNCAQSLPAPRQTLTLYNLYKCYQIDSCYKNGATNTCCGCVDWNTIGVDVPPPPITKACINSNLTWTRLVRPKLAWIKKACPTVYTYPFDDPSSTYTCKILKNNINSVNYVITFCPGGKTGGVS